MSPRQQRPDQAGRTGSRTPSRRDQLRPVELIGIAAVLSVFVGLVVLMATREPVVAVIFFGVAFIIVLVVLAMFVLGYKPDAAEQQDLAEQNGQASGARAEDAPSGHAGDGSASGGDSGTGGASRDGGDGSASGRWSPHN
jgi:uncharacterized membrane protein YgcG